MGLACVPSGLGRKRRGREFLVGYSQLGGIWGWLWFSPGIAHCGGCLVAPGYHSMGLFIHFPDIS